MAKKRKNVDASAEAKLAAAKGRIKKKANSIRKALEPIARQPAANAAPAELRAIGPASVPIHQQPAFKWIVLVLVILGTFSYVVSIEPPDDEGSLSNETTVFRVVEAGGETGDGMLSVRVEGDLLSCTRTFEGDPFSMVRDQDEMGIAPGVRLECPAAMIVIVNSGGLPYETEP